ncbi:hypothetical protein GDO81_010719 [Engystomops pustulosus]|uniref:P-type ATPase C-terminal domain-containing protein n=1 Tax=Engystomops pustulosus TaxID=76066 RepID=A0AAV7C3N3_ENGPU|nr:hypothetical protein GDO81_010719 [Engystomops pustulosus]
MFVALLFWYQFYCGFSGSTMIDQWYLIFFNLLFSSIPQLVTGILDKDLPAEMLIAVPELYRSGQTMEEYKPHMFWRNMIDAFYQSLICFFIPYFTFYDTDIDLFTWGTPIVTCALFTIMLHLGIETKTWTWINVSSIVFSILLFFTVALIYNSTCPTCNPPSNPYWTMQKLLANPLFYFICLLSPIAALLPRFLYKSIQGTMFPTQVQIGRKVLKSRLECLSLVNKQTSVPEQQMNTTLLTPSALHSVRNQKETMLDQGKDSQNVYFSNKGEKVPTVGILCSNPTASLSVKENDQAFTGFLPFTLDSSMASEALYVDEMMCWNSKVDQSDIGLMSLITSTPLLKESSRPKQMSANQESLKDSSTLPSDLYISEDSKVKVRCNTSISERIIRSTGNGELQETTFL